MPGDRDLLFSPSDTGGVPGRRNRLAALAPTVHGRSLAFSAVHGPPSYDAEGGTGSGHPATSARHLCSATLVLTTPPLPSTKTPHLVDELLFCLRHPPKRPIWWMNCPFVSAIHQNGSFCGWPPAPSPNRPGLGLVSRKVGAFSGGPSMPEACFPEGRCLFRGTFHARGLFPGRSAPFQGDLPCQRPVSRKVGAFSGGPSMPEAYFPEGRRLFRGTFHARGLFPGRSRHYFWGPATPGPFFR